MFLTELRSTKKKGENDLGDKCDCHKTDEEINEVTLLKRYHKQKEHELRMA